MPPGLFGTYNNYLIIRDEIEEADSRGKKAKSGIPIRKRIRQMKANEVVFSNALPTEFKSKDQVVLINNPNGPGLWPALVRFFI
jgi:hypothetical protein